MTKTAKPVAIIDIGSNSIRLVIYDALKRAPIALFNEKVLCGLAHKMADTGRLNENGVQLADDAIGRFVKLAHMYEVRKLYIIATSAVRDASDGAKFVADVKEDYGVDIRILSEEEEAKYAALGVVAFFAKPDGVVGDLGGGSLELVDVLENKHGKGFSAPIGPLRIKEQFEKNPKECVKQMDSTIESFSQLSALKDKTFYMVGGAFRNLAKIHMTQKNYPLKVIHNFTVSSEELLKTINVVKNMSKQDVFIASDISKKRYETLPIAALIAERIIKLGKPKQMVFSASGIREGLLYENLSKKEQSRPPLIAGCEDMVGRLISASKYGHELAKWMKGICGDRPDNETRLRLAAAILSDISCYENIEYRAELAYRRIIDSSLFGINHQERVFIAACVFYRYSYEADAGVMGDTIDLLTKDEHRQAQIFGAMMRLGRCLSASHEGVLKRIPLRVIEDKLILNLSESDYLLQGEIVDKRLGVLADLLNLRSMVIKTK